MKSRALARDYKHKSGDKRIRIVGRGASRVVVRGLVCGLWDLDPNVVEYEKDDSELDHQLRGGGVREGRALNHASAGGGYDSAAARELEYESERHEEIEVCVVERGLDHLVVTQAGVTRMMTMTVIHVHNNRKHNQSGGIRSEHHHPRTIIRVASSSHRLLFSCSTPVVRSILLT